MLLAVRWLSKDEAEHANCHACESRYTNILCTGQRQVYLSPSSSSNLNSGTLTKHDLKCHAFNDLTIHFFCILYLFFFYSPFPRRHIDYLALRLCNDGLAVPLALPASWHSTPFGLDRKQGCILHKNAPLALFRLPKEFEFLSSILAAY